MPRVEKDKVKGGGASLRAPGSTADALDGGSLRDSLSDSLSQPLQFSGGAAAGAAPQGAAAPSSLDKLLAKDGAERPQDVGRHWATVRSVYGQSQEAASAHGKQEMSIGRFGDDRDARMQTHPLQVLDSDDWSPTVNDAFVQGGLDNDSSFHVWTSLSRAEKALVMSSDSPEKIAETFKKLGPSAKEKYPTLWSDYGEGGPSIFARELGMLRAQRYAIGQVATPEGTNTEAHKGREGLAEAQHVARMKAGRARRR